MKAAAGIILGMMVSMYSVGQEIPLNSWRTHFSYTTITSMTESPNRIFASAEVGLFSVDKSDGSVDRFFTSDGFQEVGVTALHFDETSQILLVGYASGNLDLIVDGSVVNFDLTSDSQIIGSKTINDITSVNSDAYIATDYGILRFDLTRIEVRETYREIGENASQIGVNKLEISGDSIYAATDDGIQGAELENLAPFNAWNRYAEFTSEVNELAFANNRIYAIWNGNLYASNEGMWTVVSPASGFMPSHIDPSDQGLLLLDGENVEVIDGSNQRIRGISSSDLEDAFTALVDNAARIWVGDAATGLWAESGNSLENFTPSGPERTVPFNLTYIDRVYALPGGYDGLGRPLGNDFGYSTFSSGVWENLPLENFGDVTSAAGTSDKVYLGSAGDGIVNLNNGTRYDNTNSPLIDTGNGVIITDLAFDRGSLYALNLGSPTSLLELNASGDWQPYAMPVFARNATALEVSEGFAWLVIPPLQGGGIYAIEPGSGEFRYLTNEADNGGLPSRIIGDIALDKEGFMWIGTSRGVSIWFTPFQLSGSINATEPVFEGRPLLVDQQVYAIEVDGGNRKWIGTDEGAWLFDPFADELLLHFTADNSPLPSDIVRDITINEETGEVFFLTDAGMASYHADASEGRSEHGKVKIFPNPVEARFQGAVGISGLVQDAIIRITDSAGQLVYETRANGGTATWPVRQFPGGTLATGMYFVFSVSSDGSESYVGKVAVIR